MLNVLLPPEVVSCIGLCGKCGGARQATDDKVLQCMRIACWMTKGKNTHPEYVISIAFPLQQRLHECTSLLRYTYIVCFVPPTKIQN